MYEICKKKKNNVETFKFAWGTKAVKKLNFMIFLMWYSKATFHHSCCRGREKKISAPHIHAFFEKNGIVGIGEGYLS